MAKKKFDNKKELKEIEEVEEDIIDFEEFDDEDEVEVEVFKNKPAKKEKVVTSKSTEKREPVTLDCMKYLPIATFVISLLALIISIVILCKVNKLEGGTTKKNTSTDDTEEVTGYDTSLFTEITADEFISFIKDKKNTHFVYTGRPSCSYCQMMIGNYIKSVKEYDYTLYYFDTETVTSDDIATIQSFDEVFKQDFPATPMVYLVGNWGVEDVSEGYVEYATYAAFLEANGVKKK